MDQFFLLAFLYWHSASPSRLYSSTNRYLICFFEALLTPMPRIVIASLTSYVLVLQLDAFIYGFLRERFQNRYFVLRNYASLTLTQFVDTVLFTFLGLWGINESFSKVSTLFDIILVSFSIKLLVIAIAVPFVTYAKNIKGRIRL